MDKATNYKSVQFLHSSLLPRHIGLLVFAYNCITVQDIKRGKIGEGNVKPCFPELFLAIYNFYVKVSAKLKESGKSYTIRLWT